MIQPMLHLGKNASRTIWLSRTRQGQLAKRWSSFLMNVNVQEVFGQIDIYVFDQILRGNIAPGMRILDACCGYGRNLVYLLREHAEIFAIDANQRAVEHVAQLAKSLNPSLPAENFQVGHVERLPHPDNS